MQKIIVGAVLLIVVFAALILDFDGVNFDDNGCGAALAITFLAGILISLGIDELLEEKLDPWN